MAQQTFIDLNKLALEFLENKVIQVCYDSKISFELPEIDQIESHRLFRHKKIKLAKGEHIHLISFAQKNQHWIYLLRSIKRISNRYYYVLSSWYLQLVGKAHFVQQREPEFPEQGYAYQSFKEVVQDIHEKTKRQQIARKKNEIRH